MVTASSTEQESLHKQQQKEDDAFAIKRKMLNNVIDTPEDLYAATGCTAKEFRWIYDHFMKFIRDHEDDMPLFKIDSVKRASDAGNRCHLDPILALLLGLIRKKGNPTQMFLQMLFGVDQTTVCRYLQLTDKILEEILPTAQNISTLIQSKKQQYDQKKMVPDNTLLLDGTHVPIQKPEDSQQRTESYSGKKKRHTFNTLAIANKNGVILHTTNSYQGSRHDFSIFKEELPDIKKMIKSLSGDNNMKLYADLGFLGIRDKLVGVTQTIQADKKPRSGTLTKKQQLRNARINKQRTVIERAFAHLKNHDKITDPYDGTIQEFRIEFGVVTGLANLHIMWKDMKHKYKLGKPPPSWHEYFK